VRQHADGRGWNGMGEKPNHTTARKPGPLQIIQYTLANVRVRDCRRDVCEGTVQRFALQEET
jgi:hypothetical protein